jgi:hypothetical protein
MRRGKTRTLGSNNMADAQGTFHELTALLQRMPGVSVEAADSSPTTLSMTLVIAQASSIGPVVHCAGGANIPVEVWSTSPQGQVQERSNLAHLRYCLRSSIAQGGPNAALDRFKVFGNFLAWHLHASGSLPSAEANRLLTLWNGRRVAA